MSRHWCVLLLLPIAVGIVADCSLLMKYPQAVGVDGYYYVLQADSLRQTGHLLYPTSTPILFYVLAAASKIAGDTIFAVKVVSIGLQVILCAGLFALLRIVTGRSWPGVVAALVAAVSGLHVYLIIEFLKALAALALLVWAACLWLLSSRRAQSSDARGAAVLCLLAACFTHRSIWLAIAGIALSLLITFLLQREGKRAIYFAISTTVGCLVLPWALASITLSCRAQNEWLRYPAFPVDSIGSPEKFFVAVLAPVALILIRVCKRRIEPPLLYCLGVVAISSVLVTLNPFLDHSRGSLSVTGRLSNLAYLEAAVLISGLLFVFSTMRWKRTVFVLSLTAFCALVLSMRIKLPAGIQRDYMRNRAELLRQLPAARARLAKSAIIIAPHGQEFVATYALGARSQHSYPSEDENVYWIVHQVRPGWLSPMLVLAKDDEWSYTVMADNQSLKSALINLNQRTKDHLLQVNPQLQPQDICRSSH